MVRDAKLTTLGNFPALQSIGGYFRVSDNDQLRTLGDFPTLNKIGIGESYVPSEGQTTDSVSIVVERNNNLLLCSWLESFLPTETHAVTGDIYINNNATGCATTEEIKNPPPVLVAKNPIFAHTDSMATSFNIYANVRWQLATSDDATWITSLSSGSSTHSSRITGENEATITLMHTRVPNETPRSTTLMLTAIDENGNELTNPATMTINFTQLSTFYEGDIILSSQAEVNEFTSNATVILGTLTIGYTDFSDSRSDITDLTSLSNVTHITGNLRIQQNEQLDNINDLYNLQSIGGYFRVTVNDQLTTLGNFSELQSIGGYFSVSNNDQLTTLGDFPELQSIRDFVAVFDNDRLTTFGDFPELQSVGGNFGVSSTRLTKLGDFPALQTIGGYFSVESNDDELATLGDFPALQSIRGFFNVNNNDQLRTLGDFSALQTIGEYFSVWQNSNLSSLGDFSVLQSIGGYFNVNNNDQLTTIGDFPELQTIGGYFSVWQNSNLSTLGDFPELQSIRDFFLVRDAKLTTLGNFPALQSIGGYFRVSGNDQLRTLGDFPTLMSIGIGETYVPSLDESRDNVSIVIEENLNLGLCSWLESFLPTETHAVTGDIYINYNATGCETTEEINNRLPVLSVKNRIFSHKDSTTTSFNVYANVRWQLATSDDATWITSLSSGSSTHSSRITGENEATITLIHTRAPNETPRSTTLTLTAIDEEGNELTNPASMTINFTQLSTFYDGSITLESQEEVDEFISNTTVILGNLTIGYTDDGDSRSNITDLTPLSNITDITGNLRIEQNGSLVNLNALNNLQTIGGYFRVRNNDQLTTLGDFSELQTIGGYFNVYNNDQLTTLGDFSVLQTIGRYFAVINNADLSTLGDFSVLQTIGRYFVVRDHNQLPTLGDFPELQSIGGYFRVIRNDTLTNLGSFPNLTSIGISTFDVYVPSLNEDRDSVSIMVENNPRLSDCCLLASFLEQGNNRVEGKTFITNNATGCDRDTIQNTCHTLIVTTNKNHQIAYDSTNSIPISFTVGGGATGWTSTITYTPADANFITRSQTEGTEITTAIILMATPTVNTGVERTATITLTTKGGIGTPVTRKIVITQQSPPTIMLSTSNQTIVHNSTDPIDISFTVGGSATGWTSAITYAPADSSFITLSPTEGTEITTAIAITATPIVNTSVERTATIILKTTGHEGTPDSVSLTITQGADTATTLPPKDTTTTPTDTTTLSTHTKESIFTLYPNPTKGTLTIEGVMGYLQMYVHDLVGREVMTYSLTPSKKTLDVSDLPSGMYVVTLRGEDKTWTEVLIIVN